MFKQQMDRFLSRDRSYVRNAFVQHFAATVPSQLSHTGNCLGFLKATQPVPNMFKVFRRIVQKWEVPETLTMCIRTQTYLK